MAEKLNRRSLLAGGAALLAASCLPDVDGQWKDEGLALCSGGTAPTVTPGDPAQAGRVLEVRDPTLSDENGRVSTSAVAAAWQKLLLALTGSPDARAAWNKLIPNLAPGQVIGIKVNTLNPYVPTRPELVKAVIESLKSAGIPAPQILVWDRRLDELKKAGLTADVLGVPVEGTLDTAQEKGSGRGYELRATCLAGRKTKLSNIITRRVDHLINLAVLKRHDASGFTGCLKNIYGCIDNPGDFHDSIANGGVLLERRFEKAIPALNALPEVAGKSRLWVIDTIIGVANGGTESPADCVPNRLLAGLDPVALDVRGRQIRDEMRVLKGGKPDDESISEPWVQGAARAGLGTTTLKLEPVG